MHMHKKLLVALLVLLLICFAESAYATITAQNTIRLYYDDGSYITVSSGTFTQLTRIDNIWYVNGVTYKPTNPVVIDVASAAFSTFLMFGLVPIISAAGLIIGLVWAQRSGKVLEPRVVVEAIVLVIAVNIVIMLATLIVSGVQNSLPRF